MAYDQPPEKQTDKLSIIQLIPNMLTLTAICAGLTAIRSALNGDYEFAVQLILLAAVLDGLDGRLARALGSDSKVGAELDSLADFLNFGVAPGFILYVWALEDTRLGWLAVLVYAVCCVTRLARFNVARKAENKGGEGEFFMGIPSPAGAMLVMLPMFVSFALTTPSLLPDILLSAYMAGIGLLMISRIPTWSGKSLRIPSGSVKYFLVAFVFVGAAVVTYAWVTLVVLCLAYVATIVVIYLRGGGRDTLED